MQRESMVFIIDDDDDMRESLACLMASVGLATRVYGTASAFLTEYEPQMPGCLILDIQMPDLNGLALYERLLHSEMALPAIFITAYADVPSTIRAFKCGALDLLEKPFSRQMLLDRVQAALSEDRRRRQSLRAFIDLDQRMQKLSRKELDVLDMLLQGMPNKQIAGRLGITERAVEMRRANMLKKLDVKSLAELLKLVITHRISKGGSSLQGRHPAQWSMAAPHHTTHLTPRGAAPFFT